MRLTMMVRSTTPVNTPIASLQRARSTKRNCLRLIVVNVPDGSLWRILSPKPSKHALLHVNYVLVAHVFIQRRAGFLDLAGGVAPMQDDPPAGALAGHAAAVGHRLHDGHSLCPP